MKYKGYFYMTDSIWNKEYSVPSIKLDKLIYTLILLLLPNLVLLIISIITETARPLINIDYILPVVLVLLNNRLCKWLGYLSLSVLIIPDVTMFVFQMFPFMDLEGALYLAPFIWNGPTNYILFILATIIYTLLLPLIISSSSKYTDSFHTLLIGTFVLIISFFISDHDIRYKNSFSKNSASHYSYVIASQTKLFLSINDMDFVKANQIEARFSPTKYERGLSKLAQPFNQKILFVLVESLGVSSNKKLQNKIIEPMSQQQNLFEYYDVGQYKAPDATIQAEIKELCAQDIEGYGLRLVPDTSFPLCLPKILASKGYQTTAFHGANGKLYDRFSWYKKAGFNNYLFAENFFDAEKCKAFNGICDDEVFPIIKNYFKEDKPSFFHWMTLTSHTPYAKKDIYSQRLDCKYYEIDNDEACRNMMLQAQFFEGLAKLNNQPEMQGVEVIIIGDHQPPIINGNTRFGEYEYKTVPWVHYKIK